MKLIQFGLFLAVATSSVLANDWWCVWCAPETTTLAPTTTTPEVVTTTTPLTTVLTTTLASSTTTEATTTTTTTPATTTTTTTTTTEAPTTTTTTTTPEPTTTTTTTTTPEPTTTTTTTTTPAPIVIDSSTIAAPTEVLDPSTNLTPVSPSTPILYKVTVEPLQAVFGVLGGAVSTTGNLMMGLLNPFGIFGNNAENAPKGNIWTGFTQMITETAHVIDLIGQGIAQCSVTLSSDLQFLGSGAINIAKSLQANVVMSWFGASCFGNPNFTVQTCLQTLLNASIDGLNKSVTELSLSSQESLKLASASGAVNIECVGKNIENVLQAMPDLVGSMKVILNV